jgi:hypothetical protein
MAYDPVANIVTDIPGALNVQQTATPTIFPPSGYDLLYFKSDNNLYRLTSSGVESQISIGNLSVLVTPRIEGVQMPVVTETSSYTMTVTDFMVLASGAAFTVTLPNASSVAPNQIYAIKKTDSSFSNIITIATTATQTIDGSLTTTLNTQNETLEVISDGSNWQILTRRIPSAIVSYTPSLSAGFGTPTNITAFYRRVGDSIEIFGSFDTGTTTTGAGLIGLPSGLVASSLLSTLNQLVGMTTIAVELTNAQVNLAGLYAAPSGSTVNMCNVSNGSTFNNLTTLGVTQVIGNALPISFYAKIPISGWNG